MASAYLAIVQRENTPDDFTESNMVEGTNSDATAVIELRWLTTGNGTSLIKHDMIRALKLFERWIIQGGATTGADSNLPVM
jgi:hypothetical protein